MPCTDCYNGCVDQTFDKCVKYTGPAIPALNICTGDFLTTVENAIITQLLALSDASGITISALNTGCSFFSGILGTSSPTVLNVINALVQGECTLNTLITTLTAQVNPSYAFNTSCLTGLPTNPGLDDIVQATINLACAANTAAAAIAADYVKASQLNSLIAAYLSGQTVTQYNTRAIPYVAYPYTGPLTNFDSSGAGLASAGFTKMYICNGNNGTVDMRGRAFIGANVGIPGGSLDAAVDPTLAANAGYSISIGTKLGAFTNTLVSTNMPAHSHPVTDPGHSHPVQLQPVNSNGSGRQVMSNTPGTVYNTGTSTTGITIGNTGGSQPHDNTQPSIGGVYIVYLP